MVLVLLLGLTTAGAARGDAASILDLVEARLALMKPVAAFKFDQSLPVEDLAREAVVLEKATEQAKAQGIDAVLARQFFRAQIEVAKEIQHCWIARWQAGEATVLEDVPDLKAEIRPQLIEIGQALLKAVATQLKAGMLGSEMRPPSLDCLSQASGESLSETLGALRLAD